MKKIILLITMILSIVNGDGIKDIDVEINRYYIKYMAEWKTIPKYAIDNIITSYARGKLYGLGETIAAIDFAESRGGIYMVNVHSDGRVMDCGRYGSNTKTYHYYTGIKNNKRSMVRSCYMLMEDTDLALAHTLKTLNIANNRYSKTRAGKEKWRHMVNYYNTGRDKLIGDYYIRIAAIIKMLKEVLPLEQIKLVKVDNKYVGVIEDSRVLIAMSEREKL